MSAIWDHRNKYLIKISPTGNYNVYLVQGERETLKGSFGSRRAAQMAVDRAQSKTENQVS